MSEHDILVGIGLVSGTGVGIGLMWRLLNAKIDKVDDKKVDKAFCSEHIKNIETIVSNLRDVPATLAEIKTDVAWMKKRNGG